MVWTEVRIFNPIFTRNRSWCNFLPLLLYYMQNHLVPISPRFNNNRFIPGKKGWLGFYEEKTTNYVVFMESGIRRSALCSSLLKILCLISIQDDAEGIWKIMANNRSFLFSLLSMGQVIYSYGNYIFFNYFYTAHSFSILRM